MTENFDANPDVGPLDPDRVRSAIEVGINGHPDQARCNRMMRAGAEFIFRRAGSTNIEILLEYTDRSPDVAKARAAAWSQPASPAGEPGSEPPLLILATPAFTLRPSLQG